MSALAEQVNQRRIWRGREPVSLMRLQRIIRFIAGQRPPAGRCPLFQHKERATYTDASHDRALRLRRVYMRAPRGRAA
jgi:hypothetical protein